MKAKQNDIPSFTTGTFKEGYFQESGINNKMEAGLGISEGHFEIHRREDYRYQCKEVIPAHRLEFFMVNLVTAGEGIKTIGAHEYYLKRGMFCFESPGKVTSWQAKADNHAGYFSVIGADFFEKHSQSGDKLTNYPFFEVGACSALQLEEAQIPFFEGLMQALEAEYSGDNPYKADIIYAYLTILLKKLLALYTSADRQHLVQNSNAGIRLTKAFTRLFQKDFENLKQSNPIAIKSLEQYASTLHVSKNHLIDTVKMVSGKPPGLLIHQRMAKEAAQLLIHTELDIAEIAYLLNFETASYFTRFFKKYMDLTPTSYREATKLITL
jgi:AraC family transcriptional activator of pobA